MKFQGFLGSHGRDILNIMPDFCFYVICMILEIVIGIVKTACGDVVIFWSFEVSNEVFHIFGRRELVFSAVDDESWIGARSEEVEIEHGDGRSDDDELGDIGSSHEELHAYPGSEGVADDDMRTANGGIVNAHPVEGGCGIGEVIASFSVFSF